MNIKEKLEHIHEYEEGALLADGFEDAIIGVIYPPGGESVIAYDTYKCIQILIDRDGMSEEEALEYFQFNVAGAYVGERTPVFVQLF